MAQLCAKKVRFGPLCLKSDCSTLHRTLIGEKNNSPLTQCSLVISLILNCNNPTCWDPNSGETDGRKREIACQDLQQQVHCGEFCSSRKKFHLMEINWLGESVLSRSLQRQNPASKWLNLAFVGARNRSRSLPHNPAQWKSIGSFGTRGLIKTGPFFSEVFGWHWLTEIIKLGSNCSPRLNCCNPFWPAHPLLFSPISSFWSSR